MPLVTHEPEGPTERPPWRGVVVGLCAAILFTVALAVAAFATRDTTKGVPFHPRPDAGFADAGFVDAGDVEADAGPSSPPVEGPIGDVDAGPIFVAGPPVNAADVATAMLPVVAECLRAALRFDPSLGGRVTLRVIAERGALSATLLQSSSPVLASCVTSKGKLPYETPRDAVAVEAKLTLDGLRGTVKLVSADVVALPQ